MTSWSGLFHACSLILPYDVEAWDVARVLISWQEAKHKEREGASYPLDDTTNDLKASHQAPPTEYKPSTHRSLGGILKFYLFMVFSVCVYAYVPEEDISFHYR